VSKVTIDEKAKIPLFAVFTAVPTFFGFVFWLTAQQVNAEHMQTKIEQLEQRQDRQFELLTQIRDDVLIIKEQLKNKSKGE
jgi:hypothetical protein